MLKYLSTAVFTLLTAIPAFADVPRVVTDIPPVHGLTARVMQGVGTPGLLLKSGQSPHDHALRPSEAGALDAAELVIWIGPDLMPGLAGTLDRLSRDAVRLTLLDAPQTRTLPFRETPVFGPAAPEAQDDHAHDHQGARDPHAWLDPGNGKAWLTLIADTLATLDPANAETYRGNAVAGQREIDAASADIAQGLLGKDDRRFLVFHDAYQYFERAFGLNAFGAISLGDAAAPSPARIDALHDAVAQGQVACVVGEPQVNPGLIDAVLAGTPANRVEIDPLGMALEPGPGFYVSLLRDMGQRMAECL